MLLAEAMAQKNLLAQEIVELADILNAEALYYPGETFPEVAPRLTRLDEAWEEYLELEINIWNTGMVTLVAGGENLWVAIARRDAMNQMGANYARLAVPPKLLYNQKDALSRDAMRQWRDKLLADARLLDFKIQEILWTVEI